MQQIADTLDVDALTAVTTALIGLGLGIAAHSAAGGMLRAVRGSLAGVRRPRLPPGAGGGGGAGPGAAPPRAGIRARAPAAARYNFSAAAPSDGIAARTSEVSTTDAARATRRRAPPLHPIVLAHGLFGFAALDLGPITVDHWRGIPAAMRAAGCRVYPAEVHPSAPIPVRAGLLAAQIRALGEPVHIIGHSMGGLDARYAVSRLGLAGLVKSISTVSTPHRGSAIADWVHDRGSPLFKSLGAVGVEGARLCLRRRARIIFDRNAAYAWAAFARSWGAGAPDHGAPARLQHGGAERADRTGARNSSGTRCGCLRAERLVRAQYRSYAGALPMSEISPVLQPLAAALESVEGPNDGLVSISSAAWGAACEIIPADHMEQIGWRWDLPGSLVARPHKLFDAPAFYTRIALELP